ncbi:PepSY domain-containing protein [Pendulispora brunnea]|uniref:PepSY domain-containing protein n=1 Tax=Pendulispora brunnea TaxID=2905690 RepID=A0ABZ2JYK3_9BACT
MRSWYFVHKWTSVVATLFLLMLCVTGMPLIFRHEVDRALGYEISPSEIVDSGRRVGLDAIISAARAKRHDDIVQFVLTEPGEPWVRYIRLGKTVEDPEASAIDGYDVRTGEFLGEYVLDRGVTSFLLKLHVEMFAGLAGTLFLGFMGLLLVASLVSGTVLYGTYMRRLPFGTVRRRRSPRLEWLDLHNLLGIATLVWFLVVGVTGMVNALTIPLFAHWQRTHLAQMSAIYRDERAPPTGTFEVGSPEKALDAALAASPGMELSFLAFPGSDFASPQHFVAFLQGTTPWTSKLLKPVWIDARTTRVLGTCDLPWYLTVLLLSRPLHFGNYGGMPLKVLWAVLDGLTIVVLVSGIQLWLRRRHVSFEAWVRSSERGRDELDPEDHAAEVITRQKAIGRR